MILEKNKIIPNNLRTLAIRIKIRIKPFLQHICQNCNDKITQKS